MLNKKARDECTASGVFDNLRRRVLKDVGNMSAQEPGRYREDPLPFDPRSCTFSIVKEEWVETVMARLIFDLGHESITVRQQEGNRVPRIAFRVIPKWDRNTGTCRHLLYDDRGTYADIEDADVKTISELSPKVVAKRRGWLLHHVDECDANLTFPVCGQ